MISLLICSVTMSVLALFYMALTPLLAKRYAEKWLDYAWAAIMTGFVVPFRPRFDHALFRLELSAANGTPLFSPAGNSALPAPPAVFAVPAHITWQQTAFIVWLAGAALFLAYHAARHWRFVKMTARWSADIADRPARALFQELKSEMGVSARIGLYRCSCVHTPMLVGLTAPRVLLPDRDFAADDLRLILKHELVHYIRKDLWRKCLTLLAAAIHWFNPVVYLAAKAAAAQCEISCDALVLTGADFERRKRYGEAVIGMVRNGAKLRTSLSTHFYGGKRNMKNRVFSIMDTKRKKTGVTILCSAVAGMIAAGAVFAAATADESVGAMTVISNNQTGQISTDAGRTWTDEAESRTLRPIFSDIVWWTYDEYKAWLADQKEILANLIGETGGYYDEKGVLRKEVWTREKVNEAIRRYEQILDDIGNGAKVSKSVDGGENIIIILNPSDAPSVGYGGSIPAGAGDEGAFSLAENSGVDAINLGIFATEEERLAAVKTFCDAQMKAGKMTRQEADRILSEFN
jgi:beta-lactamase regulating signal transducer with metallopeptidase domain